MYILRLLSKERLGLFCETCDRLTCRDCQLQHHRDHKYQFSAEMAAQARAAIAALVSEVSYKRVLLGSAMKVIRDRRQLIADKKKALVHEITQTVVKLVPFRIVVLSAFGRSCRL